MEQPQKITLINENNELLVSALENSENPFCISKEKVDELLQALQCEPAQLLERFMRVAQSYSMAPISRFYVGIAALGESGRIYLGANIEFPGSALNQSIHGEQCMVSRLVLYGETRLICMASSAAPCGHCRQFMSELFKGKEVLIHICGPNPATKTLEGLLPDSFSPMDLGNTTPLLQHPQYHNPVFVEGVTKEEEQTDIFQEALKGVAKCYAPYTECASGVALRTADGQLYQGFYIENAAYNPSLSPLHTAIATLVTQKKQLNQITECVLIEKQDALVKQEENTRKILSLIAPTAQLHIYQYTNISLKK